MSYLYPTRLEKYLTGALLWASVAGLAFCWAVLITLS